MTKKRILEFVNILLAATFIMTATGGVIRYLAPDMIPYGTFRLVHPLFGLAFVTLAVIHIYLNFNWIKSSYFKKK